MMRWLLLVPMVVGLMGCASHPRLEGVQALTPNADAGEAIYAKHCAECHGADLAGAVEGPDIRGEVRFHSDAQLVVMVLAGVGEMEGFDKELDDQQAADLVAWLNRAAK